MIQGADTLQEQAGEHLSCLREQSPLVHNITNYVVMNFTANVLLALGASPVMAHCQDEVEEMVALADSLVLNIGTLSREWIHSMLTAGKKAQELAVPVVLDPVGAGATVLRTQACTQIMAACKIGLVRGNASEILALSGGRLQTRGVDASHSVQEATKTAGSWARKLRTIVAITGSTDLVTDGYQTIRVDNGHPLMKRITGTGCAASAICAAFMAGAHDPLRAAAYALSLFGLAGEWAGEAAAAPGSFQTALIDALYVITPDELRAGARLEEVYVQEKEQ